LIEVEQSRREQTELDWRPGATLERLRQRAALLASVRAYFGTRGLLEVDTPQLVNHAVTDLHLHSAQVQWPGATARRQFLHTSPEYAMKRLLAAGSGDIFQICHVFRGDEQGPMHNSEFTLLEWYRRDYSLAALMQEVDALLRSLLPALAASATRYLSYEQAFVEVLHCNPLDDPGHALAACARAQGFADALVDSCGRDELLDLLMGACIGPGLGKAGPVFVHRYPASQAALACLDPTDRRVALRFELYLHGMELANGFEELADAQEQAARFRADQAARTERGLAVTPIDEFLLAALRAGLPACAGVALGFDRLLMLACGAQRIEEVLSFDSAHA
jgi:elongation factor P--(R)-beta-lysine ligase